MFESLYRQLLLGVADFAPMAAFMKRQGFKLGVGRFIAGEDLDSALTAIHTLEQQNFRGILDLLGEFVASEAGANAMTAEILATLDRLEHEPLDKYMSVKPTQLGLGVSLDLALHNAHKVLARARAIGAHICLDMESAEYVDGTLALYRGLYTAGFGNLSTVLQSYLYRSMDDLKVLTALNPALTIRIVKGAYRESPKVAYPKKEDVDANYRAMFRYAFAHGACANIASHDDGIINDVESYLATQKVDPARVEFQLLYGVRLSLQKALRDRGHRVRIYVPYGHDWYGYFTRRLAERPANLMFVLRGLFR
ncbi:MAG: proline dehydrogenase [Oscillochloris sp.]|nr:proline dehydrogenase [Oscillochloris sp.]